MFRKFTFENEIDNTGQQKKLTGGLSIVLFETHVLSQKIALFYLEHVQFFAKKIVLKFRKS